MHVYDPDVPPDRRAWLAIGEGERLDAVRAYHARERITLSNARLHAAIHVVVENQIALADASVIDTLARLQAEGLTRHEALHKIGTVVTDLLIDASNVKTPDPRAAQRTYERKLAALSAKA